MAQLVKTINGLTIASVKTRNGLAIASAKTINGLDNTAAAGAGFLVGTGAGGSANTVTTSGIDTTGANLLVVSAGWYFSTDTPTISDNKDGTSGWTPLTLRSGSFLRHRLYYRYGGTVGSGHTFTLASTAIYPSICVAAFSGIAASPFDAENGGTASSAQTVGTGSLTGSQANVLMVAGVGIGDNAGGSISIDGTFIKTNSVQYSSGNYEGSGIAYKILSAVAAESRTWDVGSSSLNLGASIASFKY